MKLGSTELLLLLAVVIIIFGPTQIPKLARMFGRSVKGFRDGLDDHNKDAQVSEDEKKV